MKSKVIFDNLQIYIYLQIRRSGNSTLLSIKHYYINLQNYLRLMYHGLLIFNGTSATSRSSSLKHYVTRDSHMTWQSTKEHWLLATRATLFIIYRWCTWQSACLPTFLDESFFFLPIQTNSLLNVYVIKDPYRLR